MKIKILVRSTAAVIVTVIQATAFFSIAGILLFNVVMHRADICRYAMPEKETLYNILIVLFIILTIITIKFARKTT